MANNELKLHIAARTAMMHAAVVLTNLGDARNQTLDSEEMALIQARLADLNRAFIETGLLATPAQAEPSGALPVDIYGRPVAWRVHLRAKGEAPTVDYDQPALFKVERSAIGWMHEQIDFKGWRGAWMEPLYLRPASARGQDAARLAFLHSTNKDADGWEWGVVRLRNVDGRVEYLWGLSDHSDIDAAIQAQAGDALMGGDRG